jgi:hypothetical protein
MRTEKELWQLVLSRQDLFQFGLCRWVYSLRYNDVITYDEHLLLKSILYKHLPEPKFPIVYCWEICKIQPRIDWINERIKQIENETI